METWILIFVVMVYSGGGPATAEFSSRERCEAAGLAVKAMKRPYAEYICVQK